MAADALIGNTSSDTVAREAGAALLLDFVLLGRAFLALGLVVLLPLVVLTLRRERAGGGLLGLRDVDVGVECESADDAPCCPTLNCDAS